MKKTRLFCFALVVTLALPLAAQTESGVFAPYVRRLEGEIRNNLVRLTWEDSAEARGPVYLFRSSHPFEAESPPDSRPVEIPYGSQYFVDELEAGITYYYFAAASEETGRYYNIPIPETNTISVSIGPSPASPPPFAEPAPIPEIAGGPLPGISALETAVQGGKAIISFEAGDVKSAALYRSVRPIRATADLLGAVIIQTGISSPFTDYPVPGIPYYYAVIAGEDLARGTVSIIPGRNTTNIPVEIPWGGRDIHGRDIRAMPLPQISVKAAIPSLGAYIDTPRAVELSPEAAMALGDTAAWPQNTQALKRPRVFACDMEAVPGGEEYALSLIVRGPFYTKNWEAARNELLRFLALPRNPENSARARFYLGQCWYYLRQPREGLFEFLAVQDRYPAEAMEWIQASLNMMTN